MTGADDELSSVLVVGAGLMGTSVALALRARGVAVRLSDRDPATSRLAVALGAGEQARPDDPPTDLAVLAVPPGAVAPLLAQLQARGAAAAYTDLASTKGSPQRAVEATGCRAADFVGGHPLAGRERSGPGAARADLFEGRPWVLTPSPVTAERTLARGLALARLCGATPVVMDPDAHDRAVALVSHAPQVLASLVAARLTGASDAEVGLAGQGVRDVTRIAASDPGLWREILASNAGAVAEVLAGVAADLAGVLAALQEVAAAPAPDAGAADPRLEPVVRALREGNAGRARLPGKHGQAPARYATVPVLVPDKPGELARLLTDTGEAGINVEDMTIEHSPGQPVGLVHLYVRPGVAEELVAALRTLGWAVHW